MRLQKSSWGFGSKSTVMISIYYPFVRNYPKRNINYANISNLYLWVFAYAKTGDSEYSDSHITTF